MDLREARFKSRMTQWGLALRTGVNQSKVSLIERGYVVPTDEERKRICEALNLDLHEIDWPKKEGRR